VDVYEIAKQHQKWAAIAVSGSAAESWKAGTRYVAYRPFGGVGDDCDCG
jgi:hypothetical protein